MDLDKSYWFKTKPFCSSPVAANSHLKTKCRCEVHGWIKCSSSSYRENFFSLALVWSLKRFLSMDFAISLISSPMIQHSTFRWRRPWWDPCWHLIPQSNSTNGRGEEASPDFFAGLMHFYNVQAAWNSPPGTSSPLHPFVCLSKELV